MQPGRRAARGRKLVSAPVSFSFLDTPTSRSRMVLAFSLSVRHNPGVAHVRRFFMSRPIFGGSIVALSVILLAVTSGCGKKDEPQVAQNKSDNTTPPDQLIPDAAILDQKKDAPDLKAAGDKATTDKAGQEDHATFMGTRARGRRFCIIADASQSMRGGPLIQLKSEILQTLGGMSSSSQFYIIFFNATDIPMPYASW